MTMTKRTQGRPPRNSGVNGRERLIEATRTYLQNNRRMSITRTEIAQGCGVTPALISYYFKDKKSLLHAVTKPLLRAYRIRFDAIIASPHDAAHKMRAVIRLLIELNAEDAFLIDLLVQDEDALDKDDRSTVVMFRAAITDLVRALLDARQWRSTDPEFSEMAVWGMCRALAEPMRDGSPSSPGAFEALQARVDFVYNTFVTGGSAASL